MRPPSELRARIAALGGAAHAASLREEGFTTHGIRVAVASGEVERVRRSWLVSEQCDPALRRAVEVGGRLSCVTAAKRLGLWMPTQEDDRIHVVVPATASRLPSDGLRLHWSGGPVAAAATDPIDPVINVLFHVARCLPRRDAMSVWESALNRALVDADVVTRVRWGSEAARALAAVASDLSDSGLETRFVVLMPTLGLVVRQQVRIDGHPVDGLIGERLVVQLDGFGHHQARERRRDLRADARLVLRGYTVLRFDYHQLFFESEFVVAVVTAAVAQGRHR